MPNHVYNRLAITGDQAEIDKLFNDVKSADSDFDFNNIIPMPPSLNVTDGSQTVRTLEQYMRLANPANSLAFDPSIPKLGPAEMSKLTAAYAQMILKPNPKIVNDDSSPITPEIVGMAKEGAAYASNILNYGHATWYGWCCEHWNTKWSAYDIDTDPSTGTAAFSTAWSSPYPVIAALAAKYPSLSIEHEWAEEFAGTNAGQTVYAGGACASMTLYDDGSKEAFDTYFSIAHVAPEDEGYRYDPKIGTYVYEEDEGEDESCGYAAPQILEGAVILRRGGRSVAVTRRLDPEKDKEMIAWLHFSP